MKRGYIYSGIVGAGFFGASYLALNLAVIPSIVVAGVAYGAGVLLFKDRTSNLKLDYSLDKSNIYELLKQGKAMTREIEKMCNVLEDGDLISNVKQICNKSYKILDIISKKPAKLDSAYNFLSYYLPVTIKILRQYDEVENNKLTSKDSKNFMIKVQNLIKNINMAFEKQLNNMYETEIINTEADIKVFETMLKTDGFMEDDFGLKE